MKSYFNSWKKFINEEKVKNPGPYISGEKAKAGIDSDGDGVPDGADEEPLDGSLKEEDEGTYEGIDEEGNTHNIEMLYEDRDCGCPESLEEAEYRGRKVTLNKPMRGDVKKFKVFVKDPKTGNVKKVNFGDPNMRIKKSNPERRRSFRARHRCENPGPKTKARYWACRSW